jgi:hypothetical protein
MNRFAGFADNGGVPLEKFTPAVARTAKPKNPTKPKSRLARNVPIDDEDGFIPNAKRGNSMTNEIDRGPFAKMLDRMALAHQAQFGGSYEQAYTKIYTAPENASIRDRAKYDDLARAHDAMYGTKLSMIPAVKAAAPADALQDDVSPGSAHDELNELVVAHMKANPALSYQQAFTREYLHPNNRSLKDRVDSESILHAQARAPAPAFPAYRRG